MLLYVGGKAVGFNPRSHVGSDLFKREPMACVVEFQSTLPRGERPSFQVLLFLIVSFNPRSHVGSDRGIPVVQCRL